MNNIGDNHKEISLKDLILTIGEFYRYIIKKWYWIFIAVAIVMGIMAYSHSKHTVTYPAMTRFVVEGQSGGGGGLGSLLGSFGIRKGGKVNPFKIIEVGRSTSILIKTMLSKDDMGNYLGDKMISEWGIINTETETNPSMKNFSMEEFHTSEAVTNNLLKRTKGRVWGGESGENSIASLTFNEDSGIFILRTESVSESVSAEFCNVLYDQIKNFFEDEVFANQKRSTDILKTKMDSLKIQQDNILYRIARFEDSNKNIMNNRDRVPLDKLSIELKATSVAYAEVVKNYEMTDVNLKDIQPLFMSIDVPMRPLSPIESSLLFNLILGGILGGFLGVISLVLHKIYKNVMD